MTTRGNASTYPVVTRMIQDGNGYKPEVTGGITIREHFAGLAMQGIVANPNFFGSIFQQHPLAAAEFAAKAADGLIAELDKPQPVEIGHQEEEGEVCRADCTGCAAEKAKLQAAAVEVTDEMIEAAIRKLDFTWPESRKHMRAALVAALATQPTEASK